jgi:uncharacterized protein YcbX
MNVIALTSTPLKGFGLHHPHSIEVTNRGVVGDRDFFLVDQVGDVFSTSKTGELAGYSASYEAIENVLTVSSAGEVILQEEIHLVQPISAKFFSSFEVGGHTVAGSWNEFFSEKLGRSVRLIKAGAERAGTDTGRLTLIGTESLKALKTSAKLSELDSRRFRMNIEVETTEAHEEDGWFDQEFRIGSAVVRAGMPVQRCVATTRNPDTGNVDLKTLKLIGDYRGRQQSEFGMGFNFGIYFHCISPGVIKVGDNLVRM